MWMHEANLYEMSIRGLRASQKEKENFGLRHCLYNIHDREKPLRYASYARSLSGLSRSHVEDIYRRC